MKRSIREVRPNIMKALVIGNSNYHLKEGKVIHKDIDQCVRDAEAVADMLEKDLHF